MRLEDGGNVKVELNLKGNHGIQIIYGSLLLLFLWGAPGSPGLQLYQSEIALYLRSDRLKLETLGFCTDGADICEVKGAVRLVRQKPPAVIAHCMMGKPMEPRSFAD